MYIVPYLLPHCVGQEFFAVEVAANALVSSNESCMRLIRQGARALYNDSYPNGMTHLCRLPTQIPMKWWPRETLRAGEVVHILGECCLFIRKKWLCLLRGSHGVAFGFVIHVEGSRSL